MERNMERKPTRREFLTAVAVGGAMGLAAAGCGSQAARSAAPAAALAPGLVSPGCRTSKVKVAKVYLGRPKAHWPMPAMDLQEEMARYEAEFARMGNDFADVEFVTNDLVTKPEEAAALKDRLQSADGVLAIHLSMGIMGILPHVLAAGKPTVLFAAPYSGHEWTGFGNLTRQKEGAMLECLLTDDYAELAEAVRPFRAIHHLREARILNVTTRDFSAYAKTCKARFGTDIVQVGKDRLIALYEAVPEADAEAETRRWVAGARKIVEPNREEIFKSCKLALAMHRLLDEEEATMITIDCYGSMWRKLPAYPCIGHARLNNLGLGGMCESDLQSAMTQILFQGLAGKPGFVNDPTMDCSDNAIILAHCMGTPKMDGPCGKAAPYQLRTIMERQEGAVCQVFMEVGRKTTTGRFIGTESINYFTGDIIEAPDVPRGCRTKIKVKVDGDAAVLWQNWAHGLHRVTCYGDLTKDLARFSKFAGVPLVNEAMPRSAGPLGTG